VALAERERMQVVLVGRGSTDPDANAEVFRAARLLYEGRGLAGAAAFVSLAEPGVPAALDRCRALGVRRVVVLPFFMFAGVLPDRITAQSTVRAVHRRDRVRRRPLPVRGRTGLRRAR
jgi:sirohydrochlorin cobaltochelatase